MSGELAEALKRRALSMLRSARLRVEWGDYDLACFDAEQAVQLFLKYMLFKYFGVETRVHGVVEHLSLLRRELERAGFRDEAEGLSSLAWRLRGRLDLLDDAYTQARYGSPALFSEADAREAIRAARGGYTLLRFLRGLEARLTGEQVHG